MLHPPARPNTGRLVMMVAMVQGGVSGLVTGTVFKIVERQVLSLAGSIPVRLRHAPRA
jgi:hypothetical protein